MIKDRDIARLAEIQTISQTVNINGQVAQLDQCILVCPSCKMHLQEYNLGVSKLDIIKEFQTDNEYKLSTYMYCQKCGQKIKLFREMPVVNMGEVKETTNEQ